MASLAPAVSALSSSLSLLTSSTQILDSAVSDYPRLTKTLHFQRHFELIPESSLKQAQAQLANEISPAVEHLLSTAEAHVKQLVRREESLRAKVELIEGRQAQTGMGTGAKGGVAKYRAMALQQQQQQGVSRDGKGHSSEDEERAIRMKKLQQRKDQLQFTIERLELQSKQKERELRKSMAFVREDD